jgi:UDP-glucose 4-epimerase
MLVHTSKQAQTPKRVVILGSSGFVGRELARRLNAEGVPTLGFSSKDLDLCQVASREKLKAELQAEDTLVFASAITPDKGKDLGAFMRNMLMVENVAAVLAEKPCAHVVYISSDAVYGDGINPIHEASPCDSGTLYGHMHRAREIALQSVLKAPLALLRLCAVYGATDTHNGYGPNRFLKTSLKQNEIALFGEGEEQRDHIFIDDACRLIEQSIHFKSSGTLNIATGHAVSFHEVATQVAQLLSKKSDKKIEIKGSKRANPVTHRHFDITGLVKSFPDMKFTSLEQGLAKTYTALAEKS